MLLKGIQCFALLSECDEWKNSSKNYPIDKNYFTGLEVSSAYSDGKSATKIIIQINPRERTHPYQCHCFWYGLIKRRKNKSGASYRWF
jgi:hypothetical protein